MGRTLKEYFNSNTADIQSEEFALYASIQANVHSKVNRIFPTRFKIEIVFLAILHIM